MIKIDFTAPEENIWKEWCGRCAKETEKLIEDFKSGIELEFSEDLYKEQQSVFRNIEGAFRGKCAYCETHYQADQTGDLDHYRPKGTVTDNEPSRTVISYEEDGETKSHPGYYWLAYDWTNLLPACILCNRPTKQLTQGKRIGKWNYFPVKGKHAVRPGEEKDEEPLLINPVLMDPSEHLKMDDTGVFYSETPEGKETIKVFGLNDREILADGRRKTYRNVKSLMRSLVDAIIDDVNSVSTRQKLAELIAIKNGKEEYTAAARVAIRNSLSSFSSLSEALGV